MKKTLLLSLIATLVLGNIQAQNPSFPMHSNKMKFLLERVNDQYVDTVNFDKLVEKGIVEMLKELDPHSTYIPQKDVQQTNEPLEGNFVRRRRSRRLDLYAPALLP